MEDELIFDGFEGFKTIKHLRESFEEIPKEKGVYLIIFDGILPKFLEESIGGHFKRKNPTVQIEKLRKKWIDGSEVIYIGQAGGNNSNATLRKRIKQYIQFGSGKPVGHWGGRYIWQLDQSDELLIAWKSTDEDPYVIESELIDKFREEYGDRPFANLTK